MAKQGMYNLSFRILYNKFPQIRKQFPQEVSDLIGITVGMIHEQASYEVPVDTGNLKNNVDLNPTEGYVHWRAPYAGFVNFGTSRMAARPFVDNAVTQVQPVFIEAMNRLAKAGGL